MPRKKIWTKSGYKVFTQYAYKSGNGGEDVDDALSTQVASVRFGTGEDTVDQGYNYNYDNVGNISRVGILNDDGSWTRVLDYHYDANNQLVRVDDKPNNQTIQYQYDEQGNIILRTYHPYTTAATVTSTATKTDSWTYFGRDNNVIKSSTIDGVTNKYHYTYYGMPDNWTDGRAITWRNGTEMASIGNVTFTYNDGQRVSKTANGVTTYYTYEGDRLIKMERDGTRLVFLYDQNGLFGFDRIKADGTKNTFYYRIDARGEIVAITDGYGEVIANYSYDPWGNILSVTNASGGEIKSAIAIANLNPFRYKSYVYDNETELYYLNSRYYDPQVCRFVSRDKFEYLGIYVNPLTCNLFVYSLNNPVNYVDSSGELAYPGEIHNQVVDRIASKYGYHSEQIIIYKTDKFGRVGRFGRVGGFGRADIISPTGKVWEVKRDKLRQIENGKEQVKRYVNNTWYNKKIDTTNIDLKTGDGSITPDCFYYKSRFATYEVNYRYAGDGVIAYDYNISEYKYKEAFSYYAIAIGVILWRFATGGIGAPMPVPAA